MALATTYDYATTRDTIISRALRICGAIGQGETPGTSAITEAAQALNELAKEWEADGMQLWKQETVALTGASAGVSITISTSGSTVTAPAFLKIHHAWYRNTSTSFDTPLRIITKWEYDNFTNKSTQTTPHSIFYDTPGPQNGATPAQGTFYVYPAMSTTWLASNTIYVTGTVPILDFDSSSNDPDVPQYLINALVWGLADQLCYEYGLGLAERSMISKKAREHKMFAMSYDQEQGSLFIIPSREFGPG
jgi:hypothetical protein